MAWSKDEIDQFLGGNQKADKLLSQSMTSTNQMNTFSSSSSFTIPEYSDPEKADPNRYKIATYKLIDKEAIESLRKFCKKHLRSKKLTKIFALLFVLSLLIGGFSGTGALFILCIFLIIASLYFLFTSVRLIGKANSFYKQTVVRGELSQHFKLDKMADSRIRVGKLSPADPNIYDLFECSSNEKLLSQLNIGSSIYKTSNAGEIDDLLNDSIEVGQISSAGELDDIKLNDRIQGRIGNVQFLFLECDFNHFYHRDPAFNKHLTYVTLFKGQCFIFQTSVPIPFPVQYDYIPIENFTFPEAGAANPNDFYKLFRCYQYQPETDIYAGLIISKYIELEKQKQLSLNDHTALNCIQNNLINQKFLNDSDLDFTEFIKSYYSQLDSIPQKFKADLPKSDQEIMNTIESEEFKNTLLGIAQIYNNTRWSIRLINNNLIFIRPCCDTFEFDVSNKDIDGQLMNLEHDVSDLIGIIEILSKLTVVRGHLEN